MYKSLPMPLQGRQQFFNSIDSYFSPTDLLDDGSSQLVKELLTQRLSNRQFPDLNDLRIVEKLRGANSAFITTLADPLEKCFLVIPRLRVLDLMAPSSLVYKDIHESLISQNRRTGRNRRFILPDHFVLEARQHQPVAILVRLLRKEMQGVVSQPPAPSLHSASVG